MDWVLELRAPALTTVFRAFSFLGDPTFFLLFIPFGYWLWRTGLFTRIGLALLISTLLNLTLKELFQVPRPDVPYLAEAGGWAFPSGHAQIAATIWLLLGLEMARRWLWPVAILLIVGVAASRVYLGVHYPGDVVAGIAVGAVVAIAAWRLGRRPPWWWTKLATVWQALAGAVLVALWTLALRNTIDDTLWQASGALVGFWIGTICQRRTVDFAVPRSWRRAAAACVLGLSVVFGLRVGLKAAFADLALAESIADVARYVVIALWLTWFAPWLFVVLGLTRRRSPAGNPSPRPSPAPTLHTLPGRGRHRPPL
ncbi:MAG: phosphatase PAP2 family protein [Thermoanaerobaculia bacterium]